MEHNVLEVAALGRIFRPGMLYDVRTDRPIPTETLWNQDTLDKALKVTPQPGTELKVEASDTIESKCSHLDVNVGLKLSFLGGLVSVTGSAAYLDDRRSSEHVERVSLKYKATTQLKLLGMEVLANMEYPDVLDKDIATHVVTAVLYGGQAVFVFDRRVSAGESVREVKGSLQIMVKSLPGIEISGEGSLRMSEEQKKQSEHFNCTFHGDFVPSVNPTTFKEAVKIYKELPSLIGSNDDNSVPVMVWLHPLEKLDSKAKRMIRQISSNLVDQVENIFEQIQALNMRCSDLIDHEACSKFTLIRGKLVDMKRYIGNYRTAFQKRLMPVLPAIRGGGKEESALAEIIVDNNNSPFNTRDVNGWLDFNKALLDVLGTHIAMMDDIKFCGAPGEADKVIMDPRNHWVVAYMISINREDDPYLKLLKDYLTGKPVPRDDMDQAIKGRKNWGPEMIRTARRFRDFAAANANNSEITFIVLEKAILEGGAAHGATIEVYEEASVQYKDFIPPSQPGIPQAEQTAHDSVVIKFVPPKCGEENVGGYEMSLKELASEDSSEQIRFDLAPIELTQEQLKPNTFYTCSVRSISQVGYSLWSQSSVPFQYIPKSPPKAILLTGGRNSEGKTMDSFIALRPNSKTFVESFPMPELGLKTARLVHQSVASCDDVVTMGGYNGQRLSSVECIDLKTYAKHDIDSMINARSDFAAGDIGDRVILVCGGRNDTETEMNLCEYYYVAAKKWDNTQNMKTARFHHAAAVLNGVFYATGGYSAKSAVECYTPIANDWIVCPGLNQGRDRHGCAALEGRLYVCGGHGAIKSCESFDPREDNWNKCADMNYGRHGFGMVAADGKLYAIGGYDENKALGSVEIYEPRNDKWIIVEDVMEPRYFMSAVVI